ncbi:MAG: tripartite tricarboxylate transporter substrate binding protein [Thioalkalivibrio sp.]
MFKLLKRSSLLGACLAFGMVAGPAAAEFPDRTITYVNPFSPGGECDIAQRMQQDPLKRELGVDVVIEYREGGGGSVGWSHVSKQNNDAYTFACFSIPHIIAQPMTRNPGYETDDLQLIYTYHATPQVLVVRKDSPFKTLEDFIEAAKKAPGSITVGGTGTASGNHLGAIRLMRAADIRLTWIPFAGSGPTIPALEGGHVGALMTNSTMAHQNSDKFRALASATDERLSFMPDVPTFKEQGYDVVEAIYRGALGPKGMPEDRVQKLAAAFEKINREQTKRKEELGFMPVYYGPEESAALVERLKVEYRELLEELKMLK